MSRRCRCNLNEVARRKADLLHVLWVHLDVREGPAVHDEVALLVKIGLCHTWLARPLLMRNANFFDSSSLPGACSPRHCVAMNVAFPSFVPFAVGEETLRSNQLAVLEAGRGLLDAVVSHGAQPFIGDEFAALGIGVIPVHEGVFFGLPIEALELVRDVALPISRNTRSRLLASRAAIRQSGMDWPGGSI